MDNVIPHRKAVWSMERTAFYILQRVIMMAVNEYVRLKDLTKAERRELNRIIRKQRVKKGGLFRWMKRWLMA